MLKALKWLVVVLAILAGSLFVWGFFVGAKRLAVIKQVAYVANLPLEWVGKRVAFISDLQIGMWGNNESTIRRAISVLVHERPDLVLIGGDFTDDPAEHPEEIAESVAIVAPLTQNRIRTFAVLGNHDYSIEEKEEWEEQKKPEAANRLSEELTKIGITVLHNDAQPVTLHDGGEPIYVVGLGPHWANEDRPVLALRSVPPIAPRIVFMHNPDSFAALPANAASFAIGGHTHGGQIRIPYMPNWSWLTFEKESEVHADGWIPDYGEMGNALYVNRGLGMSEVPIRINAEPEITMFVLSATKVSH